MLNDNMLKENTIARIKEILRFLLIVSFPLIVKSTLSSVINWDIPLYAALDSSPVSAAPNKRGCLRAHVIAAAIHLQNTGHIAEYPSFLPALPGMCLSLAGSPDTPFRFRVPWRRRRDPLRDQDLVYSPDPTRRQISAVRIKIGTADSPPPCRAVHPATIDAVFSSGNARHRQPEGAGRRVRQKYPMSASHISDQG